MAILCYFFYLFGKKENGIWQKNVLSNIIDNPTDLVPAIKEFFNNNEDEAESTIDGFVDETKWWLRNIFW